MFITLFSSTRPEWSPISRKTISRGCFRSLPSWLRKGKEASAQAGESLQAGTCLHCDLQRLKGQGHLGQHSTQDQPTWWEIRVSGISGNHIYMNITMCVFKFNISFLCVSPRQQWLSRFFVLKSFVWGFELPWDWRATHHFPKIIRSSYFLACFIYKIAVL